MDLSWRSIVHSGNITSPRKSALLNLFQFQTDTHNTFPVNSPLSATAYWNEQCITLLSHLISCIATHKIIKHCNWVVCCPLVNHNSLYHYILWYMKAGWICSSTKLAEGCVWSSKVDILVCCMLHMIITNLQKGCSNHFIHKSSPLIWG